jgi:hypothetical protein
MHISALAGIEETDKTDTAAANDKAIRLVLIIPTPSIPTLDKA